MVEAECRLELGLRLRLRLLSGSTSAVPETDWEKRWYLRGWWYMPRKVEVGEAVGLVAVELMGLTEKESPLPMRAWR